MVVVVDEEVCFWWVGLGGWVGVGGLGLGWVDGFGFGFRFGCAKASKRPKSHP